MSLPPCTSSSPPSALVHHTAPTRNPWPGTQWTQEGGRTFTGEKHFIFEKFDYSEKVAAKVERELPSFPLTHRVPEPPSSLPAHIPSLHPAGRYRTGCPALKGPGGGGAGITSLWVPQ